MYLRYPTFPQIYFSQVDDFPFNSKWLLGTRLRAQPRPGLQGCGRPTGGDVVKAHLGCDCRTGLIAGPSAGGRASSIPAPGHLLVRKCSREEFRVPVRGTASALAARRSRF